MVAKCRNAESSCVLEQRRVDYLRRLEVTCVGALCDLLQER